MKRRDFIKAIPAAALAPTAVSTMTNSADAAPPKAAASGAGNANVVNVAEKAASSGGEVPEFAEHFLTPRRSLLHHFGAGLIRLNVCGAEQPAHYRA